MASSNSTANLQLNQWQGLDKPKMEDFNSDNLKIDQALGAHLLDASKHLKDSERQTWNNGMPIIGRYTGDGNNTQQIELGFRPSFGIVFAVDQAPVRIAGSDIVLLSAFIGPDGTSLGLLPNDTGFTALYIPTAMGGRITKLNLENIVYQYIVFR